MIFLACSNGNEVTEQPSTTTTTLPQTTTSSTVVIEDNIDLTYNATKITGSLDGRIVNVSLNLKAWEGSVGSYNFYLENDPYQVLYNWIGGMSLNSIGMDTLIQANLGGGLIGPINYTITSSGSEWTGRIGGEKYNLRFNNQNIKGYGPKEVLFLVIIYLP